MSSLLVIKGPNVGVKYELGERTRVGRLSENEIPVADSNVSRVHAEIIRNRSSYTIFDHESRNGVAINGQLAREKRLMPNDEIQVGGTVFLFDSDLNIRNARFSNNSVYLYPSDRETVSDAWQNSSLAKLGGRERESVDFILRFAELFSFPPAPLPETAERLVGQLRELFNADAAVLLMAEAATGEIRPVVALPAGSSVALNQQVIATVIKEQSPVLISEPSWRPRPNQGPSSETLAPVETAYNASARVETQSDVYDDDVHGNKGGGDDAGKEDSLSSSPERVSAYEEIGNDLPAEGDVSGMYAPVLLDGEIMAVLVVEKRERDAYSLRDLGLLQAVGKVATGTLESAKLADQIADQTTAKEASETASGGPLKAVASRNQRVQEIFAAARRAADTDVTVLITGESGTGKEVLARHLHEHGHRRVGPFIAVNCGAIPPALFEAELFGYERGAFTGATRTTPGKIEAAHGGTLFLDEIGELDLTVQPKLLRFLQDKAFYRVGGTRAIDADVRIVAATNVDLAAAVRATTFREDLWYRLNVVPFHMPPLRERREDIGQLLDYLVGKASAKLGRKVLGVNDATLSLLQRYDWPGNIRELENAIERAVLLAEGRILTTVDFAHIDEARRRAQTQADLERKRETRPLAEVERQHIIAALKRFQNNQARTAEALGMHRNTLRNKIIEYGIEMSR